MKVCLVILDGWGFNKEKSKYDPINNSRCKNMRYLSKNYPSFLIHASGEYVGLPLNSMGNSEVGHLTIGSGRIIDQNVSRIDSAIKEGTIRTNLNPVLDLKDSYIHLLIMASDGGIHSHINHLFGVLDCIKDNFKSIYIHCITDGRDTAPCVALKYIEEINKYNKGKLVTIGGRYFAMDRDNNKERIEEYFNVLTTSTDHPKDIKTVIQQMYKDGCSDETLKPFRVSQEGLINKDDALLFLNFRADRMRQVVERFLENGNRIFTMVEYKKDLPVEVIFKPESISNTLSEVLSQNQIPHSHIAESEKYAHVTYFFNGGSEKALDNEKRLIIESPRVKSFDEMPEMSSENITKAILSEIDASVPFIVSNFACPDMVGHTGNYQATLKAVEKVDECIGRIYNKCKETGYILIVTADHGNAEVMFDEVNGVISKKHTSNKVPLIVCSDKIPAKEGDWGYVDSDYSLRDVSPTILDMFSIPKPSEMTGKSVIRNKL